MESKPPLADNNISMNKDIIDMPSTCNNFIYHPKKYSCIMADKVYGSCYVRECLRNVDIDIREEDYKNIEFRAGYILKESLKIDELNGNMRVRYTLRIPYVVTTVEKKRIKGYLPDIYKDITFPLVSAREDFKFDTIVETYSRVLNITKECSDNILLNIGVIITTSIVGKVQLAVSIPTPKTIFMRIDIPIREVTDVIIYGRVVECEGTEAIEGAIVGVFINNNGNKEKICHTYSGCDGYYMVRIPPKYEGKTITIMAVKQDCFGDIKPCDCELIYKDYSC